MHTAYILILFLLLIFSCGNKNTYPGSVAEEENIINLTDSIDIQYLMGHFEPDTHPDFIKIDPSHADRAGMFLRKEAYESFIKMFNAAKEDNIHLVIRSATRNFNYQKGIWERKWTGQTNLSTGENAALAFENDSLRAVKILEYSAMPGTSRHHWGTEIDLNNFNNSWFEHGEGLKLYQWLEINAEKFHFCRPYTIKNADRPNGYNEEKWHWSYFPLSEINTANASRLLQDSLITGFEGSHVSEELNIVNNYILGISQKCVTKK